MFKVAEKTELCQISLTGMRALVLVGLLMKAPRSLEEIREEFIKLNIMEESHSDDILRIDLNTLRTMGCEITRSSAKTDFKYVLLKHPFSLAIDLEEVALLKKIYKRVKENSNIETLIEYDSLFKKLASHINDNEVKEALYGISNLKNYDIQFLKDLEEDCSQDRILTLLYKKPDSKESTQKTVIAQSLRLQNDKIYLYGFDTNKKESVILNVKRIKSIISRVLSGGVEIKTTNIKFFVKNFGVLELENNETILENCENGFIVEGSYHNEFVAMQRVLSFGANCTVLEPQEFRAKIIQKLKDMRNNYNG